MASPGNLDSKSLDWLTLDDDEEIIWSGKPHKSSLVPALIVGLPLALLLVGILIIAAAYFNRENTQYVVTTDALYKKTGIISRDVQRIDFGKVQNTSYSQGFFGSQFGYGSVDISTAGGSGVEMQIQSIPEPRQVQELVNRRIKTSRGEERGQTGETKADVLDDILTELRAIREMLEAQKGSMAGETETGEIEGTDVNSASGRPDRTGGAETSESGHATESTNSSPDTE